MSKLSKLAGETALYGLGSIVPRVLNFFLIALHTRIFHPGELGLYTNLYAWVAFLNIVYLFGLETAYFRFATRAGASEITIFKSAQTFILTLGIFLTGAMLLFAAPIADYFGIPNQPELIRWLAMLMFLDAAVSIPFARLRIQKKALRFVTAKLINVALVIGLNLYFLLVIYDPAVGIGYPILANLIANAFYVLFFATTLIQWRPVWEKETLRAMFSYSWPIMLMGLAGMTNEMFSRLTLGWWLPEGFYPGRDTDYAWGVFGACFRFSVIINVAVQAFRFAAEPFFFSNAQDKNSPELFARVNHYFIIVCGFMVLSVVVHLDWLKYLIDAPYWEGLGVVPYLLYGYVFLGVYYNLSIWYKLTDRTYAGTAITVLGMVITIGLNYLLIPVAGYLGSSWATLACYTTMAITSYALGQKYYPVPYRVGQALFYLGLSVVLINLGYWVTFNQPVADFLFHCGLMGIYAAVVYVREKDELRRPEVVN
ncbi:MAG: oligosaccharide flippase family protein [Cyclobacteriaceae bacterium]|nr:oligosaccharide flippase family protein [Cyclobacteriaceae bacterium]